MTTARNGPHSGFTLLELLVALAVFAVISVAAYSGLQSVLFTQVVVELETQRLAQVQMAFNFLERDMEQAVPRGIRDEYGLERPALESNTLGGELLTLTRAGWDNPLEQERATLQRLAYRLQEGRLVRQYWDTLDRSGIVEPRETTLLDDVLETEVRFLDEQDAWQPEWPPRGAGEATTMLPRAIEFSVVLGDWGEITRLFRLPETLRTGPPQPGP